MTTEEAKKNIESAIEWKTENLTGTLNQAVERITDILANLRNDVNGANLKLAVDTLDSLMQETSRYASQAKEQAAQLDTLHHVQNMMKHINE
jgi:hypothetical protein